MKLSDDHFLNYLSHNEHLSLEQRIRYKFLKNYLRSMEEFTDTFSIIIQGPLNERSINTIPEYLNYGEVIVSCWETDDFSKLEKYKDKIKLVINKYSNINIKKRKTGSQAPWIYQNYTTLNGIKAASKYFCIKVRSDESYPVLDPFLNKLRDNRDTKNSETGLYNHYKIVTSNIYFRYDWQNKFHPSDHIIGGIKSRMLESFKLSTAYCQQELTRFPEQLICKAIINSYWDPYLKKQESATDNESIELMKKHFDIVRIKNLPKHIWTSSYRKYDELYSEEDWCHDINSIDINTR